MDINSKIDGLGVIVNCEVEQDEYSGEGERYITFTYEDERSRLQADNTTKADIVYLQISYFCPKDYAYMEDKHKIRDYLEKQGFKGIVIRSWLEEAIKGVKKIRRVLFETNYTETRRKSE